MDFAVCPACGQSVLDDDAENCPFCGSSMKAKPGTKPPAKPAAAAAVKQPARSPGKSADDLPFDADAILPQATEKVFPTPSKTRSLKVVCPMCDTAGYVTPSAAGKPVKCANAGCHVPVFTAPAPKVEAPPPPPPKQGNPLLLGVITAAVVGGIGVALWWFASQPSNTAPEQKLLTPEDIAAMKKGATQAPVTPAVTPGDGATAPTTDAASTKGAPPAAPSREELVSQTLHMMKVSSLATSQNRSKPYCRRLAAESAAFAGDAASAREHLDALEKVGSEVLFYRVAPLVELFWRESATNSQAAADLLSKAVADAAKLPKIGRDQLDLATRLAAALAATGRADEARDLIKAHQSSGLDGETSAYLQIVAADPTLIDTRRVELRPLLPRQAPQAAATAALLVLRGRQSAALDWSKGWTEPLVRAECLTALVEASILDRAEDVPAADIDALPAEQQVLLWSRAARRQATRNQLESARQSLAKAAARFDGIAPPEEMPLPDTRGITRWKPGPTASAIGLAAGAAELAVAQQTLAQDSAAALKALQVAMAACRALGPSYELTQGLAAEVENLGTSGLQQKLKEALELKTADQSRQMAGVYRTAVNSLWSAAQDRLEKQVTILSRAAQAGLEDAVWQIVSTRTAETDPAQREPYFQTNVAGWLIERFQARKADDLVKTVQSAAAAAQASNIRRPAAAEFEELIAAGKYREAAAVLQRNDVKPEVRESLALSTAIHLAGSEPLEKVWQYISQLGDSVLKEQAYEYAALIATRRQEAAAVAKQIAAVTGATEKIALGRGLLAGLSQIPQ